MPHLFVSQKTKQPVEKVQVISSFYPWRAKLERKWQHGRKICSSIVDFFNRLERFLRLLTVFSFRRCRPPFFCCRDNDILQDE